MVPGIIPSAGKIKVILIFPLCSGEFTLLTTYAYIFGIEIYGVGNTVGAGLSAVTVSIRVDDPEFTITDNYISIIWTNPYEMSIVGSFSVIFNNTSYGYVINGTFTIPEEYHQ